MGRFKFHALWQEGDAYLPRGEAREGDIVIPIMGPTGAGKSTFINNLLPKPRAAVSAGFNSCTKVLSHYYLDIPVDMARKYQMEGRRLVLVDTPGFDDTNLPDAEILRRICVWLASSYDASMKVGGVIYLFPIYPNRVTRNDRSNMEIFLKLCGQGNLSKITLATTRWNICPADSGKARERELRTKFWSQFFDSSTGATAASARLDDTRKSALAIIDQILGTLRAVEDASNEDSEIDGVILQIQSQLVDKGKTVAETAAAKELRRKLKELLKESGSVPPDQRAQRLQSLGDQIQELKVPLSTRIMGWFGL